MKIAIINGSPKVKDSNSEYFLYELKNLLTNKEKYKDKVNILHVNINSKNIANTQSSEFFEDVYDCDVIVFGFPVYVDGLPSSLLSYMMLFEEYIKSRENKKIRIYAISNCGFYEGSQNEISLNILKNWCDRCSFIWGQGIGHGAGEMMGSIKNVPLGYGPKKNLGKALNTLSENIIKRKSAENILICPNFPKFAFRLAANNFWNIKAKSNKLKRKDLHRNEK